MNFNNINCVSASYNNNNTNNWNNESRISILSLQKENFILKSKVSELTEVNANLIEKIRILDSNKREMVASVKEVEILKREKKQKEIELINNEKFLKEFYTKSKTDNDHIIDLEDKIEHLNFHIKNSNNEINNLQSDIITLKTEVENLRIFKNKYYNLLNVFESVKKENSKLKKNLEVFYKENHFAALKIKELEQLCDNKINYTLTGDDPKEKEEIKQLSNIIINKINKLRGKINHIKSKE